MNHIMRWVNGVKFTGAGLNQYAPMIFDFDELRYGSSPEDVILSPSAPDGDFNFDGVVNAADYVTWRKNDPGNEVAYGLWRTNFGAGASAAGGDRSPSVPPPFLNRPALF